MSGKEVAKILLFNKWETSNIEITDPGLTKVISFNPSMVIPISFGRHEHQRLKKAEVNLIERLANKLMRFGKKYAKNTGRMGGKKAKSLNVVKTAFEIINLETGKNPVELLHACRPQCVSAKNSIESHCCFEKVAQSHS